MSAPPETPDVPPAERDAYAAFRSPGYRSYSIGNFVSVLGRQMLGLAVGYEVFQRTHSATALGLVGLTGALPVILLALPAGQVADRFSRKSIIISTQFISLLTSIALAWLASHAGTAPDWPILDRLADALHWAAGMLGASDDVVFDRELPLIYGLLLVGATARTFGWAARAPFVVNLVPREVLPNALTWGSSLFEIGSVAGPAIGGLLIAKFGFSVVYSLDAIAGLFFIATLWRIHAPQEQYPVGPDRPMHALFSGMRFVWKTKVILATITLDLFAVLLGGATALLPMFADEILGVGASGLGWLRAAPPIGAVTMALALAHLPPMRRAGVTLLGAVAGFGLAMVVFGLSRSFWLSMAALSLAGACDVVSVVVRHTLLQLLTPDVMRGRVAAVNNIFIGSSNELGAFESGATAELFGPVISVVAGGIGTILVVIAVACIWPQVRRIGPLSAVCERGP